MDELKGGDHQDNTRREVQRSPPALEHPNPTINNAARAHCCHQQQTHWPQYVEAACAILLVIITGCYTYYAAGQLHKMKRSVVAAEGAASAAQAQIGQMKESNSINREALETVQRAFVNFGDAPELVEMPQDGLFSVDIAIENSGATQAHALKDRISWIAPTRYLPDDYAFPDRTGKFQTQWAATGANVISGKSKIMSQLVFIPEKFFAGFVQQNHGPWPVRPGIPIKPGRNIVLYGWAIYRDAFKSTPTHLTEFCRELSVFKIQGNNASVAWQHCPTHNCTDEDCPDYNERLKQAEAAPTVFKH